MNNRKKFIIYIDKDVHTQFKEECYRKNHILSGLIEHLMKRQLKKWKVKLDETS